MNHLVGTLRELDCVQCEKVILADSMVIFDDEIETITCEHCYWRNGGTFGRGGVIYEGIMFHEQSDEES